jgi:indole-3-glycerol phosphate synthase
VLLIASVCSSKLSELLDACTLMGTEAIVEVRSFTYSYMYI